MHQMVFRFPTQLKDSLKKEADARGQTLTGIIKQILWEWLEQHNT